MPFFELPSALLLVTQYAELQTDLNAPAGTVDKTLTAVPAGYVRVVTNVGGCNANAGAYVLISAYIGGVQIRLLHKTQAASGVFVNWDGKVLLMAGDYIGVRFYNVTLGHDLYWCAVGYDVKVP